MRQHSARSGTRPGMPSRGHRAAAPRSAGKPNARRRPPRARLVATGIVVTLAAAPLAVRAQTATDVNRAPTLTIERYSEDWSTLADPANRTGRWTERLKYVPLSGDGSVYLTTGVELRSRYESYTNPGWGAAPDDDYVWHRAMPYADLHAGRVRLFAQPILSAISGTGRQKLPVDSTGADMLQAFAEVEAPVLDGASLRLSAGRKLLSLGAGRFVDTRYGPNVPLAFDGVDAVLAGRSRQLRTFYLRPVENRLGDLNDRASARRALWGGYATQWLAQDRSTGFDVYYLGFRDRAAVFDQGSGRQVIHTAGTRIFGDSRDWFWNVEGAIQRGTFAAARVAAWGVGGEIGRRFPRVALRPEVALTLDIVSGDDDPADTKLGTLNPMFPRGKYFASQSPVGPRNVIHLHPSATVHPAGDVAVSAAVVAYWRESRGDGVYAIPGNLVRSGAGSEARFIGKQFEIAASWQTSAELNLSASIGAFYPGAFIRETGPARTMTLAGAMANFRF